MKVVVLTPATNLKDATKAHHSVLGQDTQHEIEHVIVNDGFNQEQFKPLEKTAKVVHLPYNTGKMNGGNWYGHKIYAHFSQLIDADYLCLLDEDNYYESTHIEDVVGQAKLSGIGWSYRKIIDWNNQYIGIDKYESICEIKRVKYLLVDTNTWCFAKQNFEDIKAIEGEWGADRKLTEHMVKKFGLDNIHAACTKNPTLVYKVIDQKKRARFLMNCVDNQVKLRNYYP